MKVDLRTRHKESDHDQQSRDWVVGKANLETSFYILKIKIIFKD